MHGEMLTYGLKRGTQNELLHIDSVPNGLDCGCVCPHCQHDLIARNRGVKRIPHFAHASGAEDCGKGRMTALHMLVQNVLEEKKQVLLPPYYGKYLPTKEAKLKTFDHIYLEETCKNEDSTRRPDCIGYNEGKSENLWIEIYCCHKIDDAKKEDIINRRQYCIEIDFSDLLKTNYSKEDVEHRLLEDSSHSEWICCPFYDKKNEENRVKAEQEEENRRRFDEECQLHQEAIKKQYRKDVLSWYEDGDSRKADAIICEIKNNPYRDFNEAKIYDALVPYNNFMKFIDESPKNESGLNVFYTLLWYYYNKVTLTDYQVIKQNLKLLQYSKAELTIEEKTRLEEVVSLRILYILDLNRKRYSEVDPDEVYKTCIKKYLSVTEIRNEILMLVSVLYHQIVGANSKTFGELTQEIINNHPNIAKIYLMVVDSQDKYPNDYTLEGRDMLSELRQFVAGHDCNADEYVRNIMQKCYSFVFEEKDVKNKEVEETIIPISNSSKIPNQYAWDQMNKWYQES